jgi:hypothetical protein
VPFCEICEQKKGVAIISVPFREICEQRKEKSVSKKLL